jgi:hypothetical protein
LIRHFKASRIKAFLGTGPAEGRRFCCRFFYSLLIISVIRSGPCCSLLFYNQLEGGSKNKFTIKYNEDCWCPCPIPKCPFHAISSYLKLIPDPYGVNDQELKFMRAKTARGTRRFIDAPPLGENMLKQIIPRLNELLPGDLRLAKATAHSGRHNSASIAVNSGVDPITVSKVTKHKDPKT